MISAYCSSFWMCMILGAAKSAQFLRKIFWHPCAMLHPNNLWVISPPRCAWSVIISPLLQLLQLSSITVQCLQCCVCGGRKQQMFHSKCDVCHEKSWQCHDDFDALWCALWTSTQTHSNIVNVFSEFNHYAPCWGVVVLRLMCKRVMNEPYQYV